MKNFIEILGSQSLTGSQAVIFNDICKSYVAGYSSEDFEISEKQVSDIVKLLQYIGFDSDYDTEYEILTVYFE